VNYFKGALIGAISGFIFSVFYAAIVTVLMFIIATESITETKGIIAVIVMLFLGLMIVTPFTIPPYTIIGIITGFFISIVFSLKNPHSSHIAIFIGIVVALMVSVVFQIISCSYLEYCFGADNYYILMVYPALVHIFGGGYIGWLLFKFKS
jgi:hypothetical protein